MAVPATNFNSMLANFITPKWYLHNKLQRILQYLTKKIFKQSSSSPSDEYESTIKRYQSDTRNEYGTAYWPNKPKNYTNVAPEHKCDTVAHTTPEKNPNNRRIPRRLHLHIRTIQQKSLRHFSLRAFFISRWEK